MNLPTGTELGNMSNDPPNSVAEIKALSLNGLENITTCSRFMLMKHLYHHVRQAHKDGPALWDQYMKSKQEPVKIIDTAGMNKS